MIVPVAEGAMPRPTGKAGKNYLVMRQVLQYTSLHSGYRPQRSRLSSVCYDSRHSDAGHLRPLGRPASYAVWIVRERRGRAATTEDAQKPLLHGHQELWSAV